MRFVRFLLCAAFIVPAAAGANDLLRVYDQALINDTQLQASAHARDAALQAWPQARAAFLPQINGSVNQGKTYQDSKYKNPVFGSRNDSFTTKSLSLTLNQAIFNWQAIQQLRQADDQTALAEAGYRAAEQSVVLRVAEAYFGALSAADNLRSAGAENKAVERQLEQAKKRFEVGLSAITDVQEAQARYDLTVAQMIEAEQALSSAKEALAVITGSLPDKLITLQEDIPLPAPDPADVNAWINTARENNLEVISAQISADIAQKAIRVAESKHLPTLGLLGQYQDGEQGGLFGAKQTTKNIQLQLSVPIFSGGATQSGVRAAEATHEQRLAELEGKKRQVDRQTRDAYQGVLAGAARVKALKQAVLSNTTALEASETGLQVGARTAVDVLNAQQQLYSAQRNYSKARYDYLLSVLRLKAAAGRLNVQDLAEIDRLLISG